MLYSLSYISDHPLMKEVLLDMDGVLLGSKVLFLELSKFGMWIPCSILHFLSSEKQDCPCQVS